MDNVIIVNAYINNIDKEKILIKNLKQLKKYGKNILLISNSILSKEIISLSTNYIYNKENLLLPKERSPLKWFANDLETIHLYGESNSLAITKNLFYALNFAKINGYKNFIFIEYDNIINENDFYLLDNIFSILKNKNAFFTKFEKNLPISYDTKLFAGNIKFFIDKIILPHNIEMWNTIYPYSILNDTLEYIFPILFENYKNEIEIVDYKLSEYFLHSKFDFFSITNDINIVYNNDDLTKPILFLVGANSKYDIKIDGEVYEIFLTNGEQKRYDLDISNKNCYITINKNKKIYKNFELNLENIIHYKDKAIKYNLV